MLQNINIAPLQLDFEPYSLSKLTTKPCARGKKTNKHTKLASFPILRLRSFEFQRETVESKKRKFGIHENSFGVAHKLNKSTLQQRF